MRHQIDKEDRRILFELERNARIPDVKLAKLIGKSKDAVRYRIKRLEQAGVITGYKTWFDASKLGLRTATIYLTLLNLPARKQQLISQLLNDKHVYWLGIAEGVWNVGFTYFIRTNNDLFEMKSNMLSQYQDLIIDVQITSLVSVVIHGKQFLSQHTSPMITFIEETSNGELDKQSEHVLKELHRNSRANIAAIAAKHNTTADIVRKRMQDMESAGIIVRYSIEINYALLGYELYKAFVYLKSSTKEHVDEILQYTGQNDNIINVVKQIAPWDLELIIFARTFREYNEVIGKFTQKFADATKKVETAVMSEDIMHPSKQLFFE